jgi:cbb3-type cytochrome oxidase subunit 1
MATSAVNNCDREFPGHDVLRHCQANRSGLLLHPRLSIVHFWALIAIYIGPHRSRAADWASHWAWSYTSIPVGPKLGGWHDGMMTLSGARLAQTAHRSILRFLVSISGRAFHGVMLSQ